MCSSVKSTKMLSTVLLTMKTSNLYRQPCFLYITTLLNRETDIKMASCYLSIFKSISE